LLGILFMLFILIKERRRAVQHLAPATEAV
jgi:hypothetical protein